MCGTEKHSAKVDMTGVVQHWSFNIDGHQCCKLWRMSLLAYQSLLLLQ